VRLDDLADANVMVAPLDNAGDPALDRRRRGVEDRGCGRALADGLAAELAVLQCGRLEERKRRALLALAEVRI
jgi:hypothetical protein